jgi:hypothetical protein
MPVTSLETASAAFQEGFVDADGFRIRYLEPAAANRWSSFTAAAACATTAPTTC